MNTHTTIDCTDDALPTHYRLHLTNPLPTTPYQPTPANELFMNTHSVAIAITDRQAYLLYK